MARRTLLDISDDVLALEELLESVGGDVSDPEVDAAVNGWLDEIGSDLESKVDNYVALIAELKARSDIRREEAKRLKARAEIDSSNADFLKQRLVWAMQRMDRPIVETERYRVSVAKNGGLQPLEIAGDVPPEFRKIVSEPDNHAIRTALLEGRELSFARLLPRGERLSIR